MDSKELKKMVITQLIQEYVGYDFSEIGSEGEMADSPDIEAYVQKAVQQRDQLKASYLNAIQAQYAEIVEKLAPLMIDAGIPQGETEDFLNNFLLSVQDLAERYQTVGDEYV